MRPHPSSSRCRRRTVHHEPSSSPPQSPKASEQWPLSSQSRPAEMRHNDAAPSLNRLGLVPDRPAVLWGMAPILFVALAVSALLWGTGHELPTRDLPTNARTDAREAVAWLAAVALLLLFAYPLLGLAARWLRGLWPRYGPLAQAVFSVAEEVQRRHSATRRPPSPIESSAATRLTWRSPGPVSRPSSRNWSVSR